MLLLLLLPLSSIPNLTGCSWCCCASSILPHNTLGNCHLHGHCASVTMLGVGGVLTSPMHPVGLHDGGASQMLRRLQTRTITITTRSSSFSGMPSELKKGTTYKFVYKNLSSIAHNFRIADKAMSLCSQCTKSITVTFRSTGTQNYYCDPHSYMTKSVRIVD
jgi:plastocyanin